MVDYIVEHHAGIRALRQLLRTLEDTQHTFTLIMKDDSPSTALKDIVTTFLENFGDVASVNGQEWDVGLLEVVCIPSVISALIENDTLLPHLRAVNYIPPRRLH